MGSKANEKRGSGWYRVLAFVSGLWVIFVWLHTSHLFIDWCNKVIWWNNTFVNLLIKPFYGIGWGVFSNLITLNESLIFAISPLVIIWGIVWVIKGFNK